MMVMWLLLIVVQLQTRSVLLVSHVLPLLPLQDPLFKELLVYFLAAAVVEDVLLKELPVDVKEVAVFKEVVQEVVPLPPPPQP